MLSLAPASPQDYFIVERMKVALAEPDTRHKELAADEENARSGGNAQLLLDVGHHRVR